MDEKILFLLLQSPSAFGEYVLLSCEKKFGIENHISFGKMKPQIQERGVEGTEAMERETRPFWARSTCIHKPMTGKSGSAFLSKTKTFGKSLKLLRT